MNAKEILRRMFACSVIITLLMTSCEIQESFTYKPSGVTGELGMTTWEFISSDDDFEQLRQAIARTNLQDIYQQEERTFILPNDKAFDAYFESSDYDNVDDIPLPILRNMLRYHIVKDHVIFTDPDIDRDQPLPYETENGQMMFLSRNNNYQGLINQGTTRQWQIRTSNLESTNGVIHAVDFIVYFSAPAIDDSEDPTLVRDTIFVMHDSYVAGHTPGDANFSNTNYGSEDLLRPKRLPGSGDGTYDRKAYLMFDVDDFEQPGIVIDMTLQLAVSFARGGYNVELYRVQDNNWNESTITYSNAPAPDESRMAFAPSVNGSSAINFDITGFYKDEAPSGRISFMLDTDPWANGVDDLASKEHATLEPPMVIATLATGQNVLEIEANEASNVSNGESLVIDEDILRISGADPADIFYTIETLPTKGWLIRGADMIGQDGQFTQLDIQSLSLLYIHDGESSGEDSIELSVRDRTGAEIESIIVSINII